MNVIRGEIVRLRATRLPLWSALIALACGGGMTLLLTLTGPQNAQPPMPDIDTPEGVGFVLGIGTVLLFVPALIGTIAITSEYRHRTIGTTFLVVPRRGRVLTAKLAVYAVLGLVYGAVFGLSALLALIVASWTRGVPLGVNPADLMPALIQLGLAAAVYMLLGVGIGALARSPLVAVGIVLGYFMFAEYILMLIPGVNAIYPLLPGGATASLTRFDFLADAIASQTTLTPAPMVSPALGASILVAYAAAAATLAVVIPLRRDLA
ncbi:ABC transporter permease [Microbacterium aurugineum]|uniref:ABC transporter permease n=1 Tax=Microbacterium aurugineum TaxID=2851642 RepID=UPI0020C146C3|nr:ABC transporter permease [Microbacterium aurugineum]MCK8476073.1 ABC transporter permease [Microbacterium aurugineum]